MKSDFDGIDGVTYCFLWHIEILFLYFQYLPTFQTLVNDYLIYIELIIYFLHRHLM